MDPGGGALTFHEELPGLAGSVCRNAEVPCVPLPTSLDLQGPHHGFSAASCQAIQRTAVREL